jgi:hypothetical protein
MKKLMKYREIKTGNIYDVEDVSGLNCFSEFEKKYCIEALNYLNYYTEEELLKEFELVIKDEHQGECERPVVFTKEEAKALICWSHKCSNCPLGKCNGSEPKSEYESGLAKLKSIIEEK